MRDALDQDVQALKEWLSDAWRALAEPSLTPFERRNLCDQMKLAHCALRYGLQQLEVREARTEIANVRMKFKRLR